MRSKIWIIFICHFCKLQTRGPPPCIIFFLNFSFLLGTLGRLPFVTLSSETLSTTRTRMNHLGSVSTLPPRFPQSPATMPPPSNSFSETFFLITISDPSKALLIFPTQFSSCMHTKRCQIGRPCAGEWRRWGECQQGKRWSLPWRRATRRSSVGRGKQRHCGVSWRRTSSLQWCRWFLRDTTSNTSSSSWAGTLVWV